MRSLTDGITAKVQKIGVKPRSSQTFRLRHLFDILILFGNKAQSSVITEQLLSKKSII